MMRIGAWVGFKVVGVRMDDYPPIAGFVFVHEDRAAGNDQTEQHRLKQC